MKKIVFLDIDGTMVNRNQQISESAIRGMKQARENGHKLIICSGRARQDIFEPLLELGFDGIINSAGARIEMDQKLIFHSYFDQEYLSKMDDILYRYGTNEEFSYILQGSKGRFATEDGLGKMVHYFDRLGIVREHVMRGVQTVQDITTCQQIENWIYFSSDRTVAQIQAAVDEELDGYFQITGASFGPDQIYSGEITKKGVNKASGMQVVLDYLGCSRQDSIAIGDGPNDFEMVEFAATGVAMGNACPELKAKADYITSDIDEDGIYNAFQHLHLLAP